MPSIEEQHTHPKYPRLIIFKHARSQFYQASTFIDGRKQQTSLKTTTLQPAFKLAEGWYRKLLRASPTTRHPINKHAVIPPTVGEMFHAFRGTLHTQARRDYVDVKWSAIKVFWRRVAINAVTPTLWREFYAWRRKDKTQYGEPPVNGTLH